MSSATRTTNEQERRGEVLEVARELLADGRSDDLLSLVTQLVEQNHELATRAAVATTRKSRSAFDGYNRGLQWERTCAEVLKLRVTRGGRSSAAEQPIAAGSGEDSLHFAAVLASRGNGDETSGQSRCRTINS